MEIGGLLSVAKRWWWTLLIAPIVGAVTGLSVASNVLPTYEAEARLLIGPISGESNILRGAGQLSQTYAEVVTSELVVGPAVQRLGAPISAAQISANASVDTRLLTISARGRDPELVARTANALADQLIELSRQSPAGPEGEIRAIDIAEPASQPSAPDIPLITALAAFAALLVATVLVTLIEYFDDTVKSERDLMRLPGEHFLGSVGRRRAPTSALRPLVVESQPHSRVAVAYRLLATKVQNWSNRGRSLSSTLVVGADVGGGSAELASNLAAALTLDGLRVVLVDADLRGGQVSRLLRLEGSPGMTDLLQHLHYSGGRLEGALGDFFFQRESGLTVLPVGTVATSNLAPGADVQRLLDELTAIWDFAVIHGGSVTTPSGVSWARVAGGTILVAHRNSTTPDDLTNAIDSLRLVGANLTGTVLADQRATRSRRAAKRQRADSAAERGPRRSEADPGTNGSAGNGSTVQAGRRGER